MASSSLGLGDNTVEKILDEKIWEVELCFTATNRMSDTEIPIRVVLKKKNKEPWPSLAQVFCYDRSKPQVMDIEKRVKCPTDGTYGPEPLHWATHWQRPTECEIITGNVAQGACITIWISEWANDICISLRALHSQPDAGTIWLPPYSFRKLWPSVPLITPPNFTMEWDYTLDNSADGAAGEMALELSVQSMVQQAVARLQQQTLTSTFTTTMGFKVTLGAKGSGSELSGSQSLSTAFALMKQLQDTITTSTQLGQKVTLKAAQGKIGKYHLELPFSGGAMGVLQCRAVKLQSPAKATQTPGDIEAAITAALSIT